MPEVRDWTWSDARALRDTGPGLRLIAWNLG
jgi:hypothetical protein